MLIPHHPAYRKRHAAQVTQLAGVRFVWLKLPLQPDSRLVLQTVGHPIGFRDASQKMDLLDLVDD